MKLPKRHSVRENGPAERRLSLRLKSSFRTRAFRVGGYSVAATLIVLAIAIAVNVLAGALPASLTQRDTSSHQLYSLSEQTENLVAGLEEDVTIYWIVQAGSEDPYVDLLLDQYTALSDHLTVEKVDPDVHPTFLEQYELSSDFADAVDQQNIETEELSLLTVEAVPEDADAVLIYAPQSDLSEDEVEKLSAYLEGGGSLLLITSPLSDADALANLEGLMEESYGVSAADGIVMEGDQSYSIYGYPYYLLPDLGSHDITSPLSSGGYYVMLSTAQGLTVADELPDGVSVTELLTTSDSAYSKAAGYDLTTYDREEGDLDGPFALAVAITDQVSDETESKVVWVSSSYLVDDVTNEMISGGNQDFFLNALSWMVDQEESISIHAKSLSYDYLTINSATASTLTIVVVALIPLAYLGVGLYIWIRRKRR